MTAWLMRRAQQQRVSFSTALRLALLPAFDARHKG
jgi:hypothetical protein